MIRGERKVPVGTDSVGKGFLIFCPGKVGEVRHGTSPGRVTKGGWGLRRFHLLKKFGA